MAVITTAANGQLLISHSSNADSLASELVGPGIEITNAVLTCHDSASGFFNGTNTNLGIDSGIILSTGNIRTAVGPNNSQGAGTNLGTPGDPDLDSIIAPHQTYDACVLQFDVEPFGDSLKFDYTFGSEEYDEYVCSDYNDVFAFFISGPNPSGGSYQKKNVALIPGSNLPVAINSVNNGTVGTNGSLGNCTSLNYSQYYWSNQGGQSLEYDGFTEVLTAKLNVIPCEAYHLELKIGDGGDGILDSGIFLESESLTSNTAEVNYSSNDTNYNYVVEGCLSGGLTVTRSSANGPLSMPIHYSGTATNGVDINPLPDTINFANNQDSIFYPINPVADGLNEGMEFLKIYINNPCNGSILDSTMVYIRDSIDLTVSPDTTICKGDEVQLWAAGANVYNWTPEPTLISTFFNNAVAQPDSSSTVYEVQGVIASCTRTKEIEVSTVPFPEIDAGSDTVLCMGNKITFSPDITNTAGFSTTYQWEPSGMIAYANTPNGQSTPLQDTTFHFTTTNAGLCSNTDSLEVEVVPPALLTITNNKVICDNESIVLSGQGNRQGTITWTSNTGNDTFTGKQLTVAPQVTTNYQAEFTDIYGCKAVRDVDITVKKAPEVTIDAAPFPEICYNDTLKVQGAGASNYEWMPHNLVNSPFASSTYSIPSDTTEYILQGIASNGCKDFDTITVNVLPLPAANISLKNDSICLGDSITLNAVGKGVYNWKTSTGEAYGNRESINVSPPYLTTYSLSVTAANGCINSTQQPVHVVKRPLVDGGPDTILCAEDTLQLNATGAHAYQWAPSTQIDCSNCAAPTMTAQSTENFTLTGYNKFGCDASDTVAVKVNPKPKVNLNPGQPEICRGDSIKVAVSGGVAYQWKPASGVSNPSDAEPVFYPSNNTEYSVLVTDANGCTKLKKMEVKVNELPTIEAGNAQEVCLGETATLNASGGKTYQWQPAAFLDDPSTANPTANVQQTKTFTVTGTDANGCKNTDEVLVEVLSLPNAEAGADTEVCKGDTIALNASGGASYNWVPSIGLSCTNCPNPSVAGKSTTIYTLTATDLQGCQNTDEVQVNVNPLPVNNMRDEQFICHYDTARLQATQGFDAYDWRPSDGLVGNTRQADVMAHPDNSRKYYVEIIDDNNCSITDSIQVTYYPTTQVISDADTTICATHSAQLSASGVNSYQWLPMASLDDPHSRTSLATPVQSTTYTVVGSDENGCISKEEVRVNINPLPNIQVENKDTTICLNTAAQLKASGGVQYEWSPATGLDQTDIADPKATPADTTIYHVEVTTAKGCLDSMEVPVNVYSPNYPNPRANVNAICPDDTLQLFAENGVNYTWRPSNSLSAPSSDTTLAYPSESTEYSVSIVDSNGCSFTENMTIEVYPEPVADAGKGGRIFHTHTTILNGYGNGTPLWQPNKWISDPQMMQPDAFPDSTTIYTLTITTPHGCVAHDSVELEVFYETKMDMPNAFTPNGDGKNDKFGPIWFNEFELKEFAIYNRWGKLLFRTTNPDDHWDGTFKGEPQPMGTYIYIIRGRGNRGEFLEQQGNVTLIR